MEFYFLSKHYYDSHNKKKIYDMKIKTKKLRYENQNKHSVCFDFHIVNFLLLTEFTFVFLTRVAFHVTYFNTTCQPSLKRAVG